MSKEIMNQEELADLLSVEPRTVGQWVSDRRLPFFRIGRLLRFRLASILEWAAKMEIETQQQIAQEVIEAKAASKGKRRKAYNSL
jgi:excisionase family DNA binding protein